MFFNTKKEEVLDVLKSFEDCRDSDMVLLASIWGGEMMDKPLPLKDYSAQDMLDFIFDGELTSPETIVRIRRKLQQENPELRGKKYKARHEAQEEVKEELKERTLWQM